MTNKLIVFSAPSGAGKTTLVKYILKTFSEIEFSISATSRKARGEERDGKDYYAEFPRDLLNVAKGICVQELKLTKD